MLKKQGMFVTPLDMPTSYLNINPPLAVTTLVKITYLVSGHYIVFLSPHPNGWTTPISMAEESQKKKELTQESKKRIKA